MCTIVGLYPVCSPDSATSEMLAFFGGVGAIARYRPRRGVSRRAVFSDAQRRGLERTFQKQKYISKPDRKKLAERLALKDAQVRRGEKE